MVRETEIFRVPVSAPAPAPLYPEAGSTDRRTPEDAGQGRNQLNGNHAPELPQGSATLYPKLSDRKEGGDGKDVLGCAASVLDLENWRRGENVHACNRHMLENQLECDVWFRVGKRETEKEEGEEEETEGEASGHGPGSEERVGAHAYVLRSRSSALCRLLADSDSAVGVSCCQDIHLPNTSSVVLWQLLRYLYYEDLQLKDDTVLELITLAETYEVVSLRDACLRFLPGSLTVDRACAILETAHRCQDQTLTDACWLFVRHHHREVMHSPGLRHLCRECLNQLLTVEGFEPKLTQKKEATDRWANSRCQEAGQPPTETNKREHLKDFIYVIKNRQKSRQFFSKDTTDEKRFAQAERMVGPSSTKGQKTKPGQKAKIAESDSMTPLTSVELKNAVRSLKHAELKKQLKLLLPRTPSFAAGADLHQITRYKQIGGSSASNDGSPDAIKFSPDRNILLYGFGIYGKALPKQKEADKKETKKEEEEEKEKAEKKKKEEEELEEASYEVNTALSCQGKDMVLETISVTGAGVILPVMLDRPVVLKKGRTYTLALYVQGPACRCGVSGQVCAGDGQVTFVFSKVSAAFKGNRTGVGSGQIPRLYYLPC